MATFDPGQGTSWRYGQAILVAHPKTGNTGTERYFRYGQALTVFASVPTLAATVAYVTPRSTLAAAGTERLGGVVAFVTPRSTLAGVGLERFGAVLVFVAPHATLAGLGSEMFGAAGGIVAHSYFDGIGFAPLPFVPAPPMVGPMSVVLGSNGRTGATISPGKTSVSVASGRTSVTVP